MGGFVRGEQVWCLVQWHANQFSLARNRNRQFIPANCGSSIGLSPGSSGSGLVEGLVRLRMGRTIRIVRVEVIRPNSAGVMAAVVRTDAVRPNPSGVMAEIIHMDAIRPNSMGVMAEVIRSNIANDRLRLRVLQCGIQVVRSVRVDVFRPIRPNSIGVMAEMADIIRSNSTKRLFPGIFCCWSEAVHVVRVGSARSNSW